MISPKTKAYIFIHIAVVLFGFTAILGKLISLQHLPLVWNRMWIAALGFLCIPGVFKKVISIPKSELWIFCKIGIVIALHWITFYGSIKVGENASITLACLATAPLFTSIIEPLILKHRFKVSDFLTGILSIIGIYFITQVSSSFVLAIILGIISSILSALFASLNKKHLKSNATLAVSFIELSSGWLFLSLMMPFFLYYFPNASFFPNPNFNSPYFTYILGIHSDWYYMLVLSLVCTCIAFSFALDSLRELSAFTSSLTVNLEPVYGIILAALFFNENQSLNLNFYIGTSLILLSVILQPFITKIKFIQ